MSKLSSTAWPQPVFPPDMADETSMSLSGQPLSPPLSPPGKSPSLSECFPSSDLGRTQTSQMCVPFSSCLVTSPATPVPCPYFSLPRQQKRQRNTWLLFLTILEPDPGTSLEAGLIKVTLTSTLLSPTGSPSLPRMTSPIWAEEHSLFLGTLP